MKSKIGIVNQATKRFVLTVTYPKVSYHHHFDDLRDLSVFIRTEIREADVVEFLIKATGELDVKA